MLEDEKAVLDELEQIENTFDSENVGIAGLGKTGQKFFASVKKEVQDIKNGVKKAAKDVVHAVVKYNPLSLAARGADPSPGASADRDRGGRESGDRP